MTSERIVFMHIPKTAGTTVRSALTKVYRSDERAFVYQPNVPDSITLDDLASLPAERQQRLKLVMGHFAYGIDDPLPGRSRYVTMVREPMDRLVSLYFYFMTGTFPPGSGSARQQARLAQTQIPIDEYAFDTKHLRWDNQMVRLVSGHEDVPFGHCSEAMLTEALEHVDAHFDAVLLQERMTESMAMLGSITGRTLPALASRSVGRDGRLRHLARLWERRSSEVPWTNATRERKSVAEVDPASLRRMRELNHLDVEFYRVAVERFPETYSGMAAPV